MKDFKAIENLFECKRCKSDLEYNNDKFECKKCNTCYPIIDGIPRFVDESFYQLNEINDDIERKTKNYFGFEWDYFKDWGYIKDEDVPEGKLEQYLGGRESDRKLTYDSKCRLTDDEIKNKVVLDAGCGNGRYTYETRLRGDDSSIIIGVDIGYGSVQSSYDNTKEFDNVFIIQGSLFDLPFKNNVINSCFSNGVLMHTGNMHAAFNEVCRTIKPKGIFVAHVYGKLNPLWEFNDWWIRKITTKLSIEKGMKFAKAMANISRVINKIPYGFDIANLVFRIQPSVHHMFDWYSAPTASHHTYKELEDLYVKNNFRLLDNMKEKLQKHSNIIVKPWAVNLKGMKLK
jgi:SAM-dependent methyltransferase